jgi:uncharacterized protein
MKYRKFGKLDWQVSALGFGCMRLPTLDQKWVGPNIDEAAAVRAVRHAIDEGVNYIDTAYPYHGGNSELFVGRALRDGYRDQVRLATKSPTWMLRETGDFNRLLNEQLRKLQTDHIDFYLLHGLNRVWWRDIILKLGVLEQAQQALRDGRIAHLGFSFHDESPVFDEIMDGYDGWEFCQLQYNYMDIDRQAGVAGLRKAAAKGLAVIIMEPLLGGRLSRLPAAIQTMLDEVGEGRSATDWALQWLWDQPEVSVVLSGMSNFDQVRANLDSANRSQIGSLTSAGRALIERVRQAFQQRIQIPCTKCGYCLPCLNDVNIPTCFEIYNDAFLHDDLEGARTWYRLFLRDGIRGMNAESCLSCHECEARCPQHIPISEWMPKVHDYLRAPGAA